MWRVGLVVGVIWAAFTTRVSRNMAIRSRTQRHPLYLLTHGLTQARDLTDVLGILESNFVRAFRLPLAIVLLEREQVRVHALSSTFALNESDLEAARLAVRYRRRVGRGTPDLPHASSSFLPLQTSDGALGAIGFKLSGDRDWIGQEEWPVIENFANQAALAVLRARLQEQARKAAILSDADKLQKTLLNSISHNVRTPLASIIGALSTLQEDGPGHLMEEVTRRELLDTARDEAERLNRLLGNLLDMSRLEAGALPVRMDLCDVQDLIGAALEQLSGTVRSRLIEVHTPTDLPFVRMDFVLIAQVLVNLLDNAVKYSPPDSTIRVDARVFEDALEISVSDSGPGIAEQDLLHVFEKFNRAGRSGETGGIGLGLSICKGLVEAHGGRIWAERRNPHGTTVTFTIPCPDKRHAR
jgi:two-component system, OmpR family, sensor histidine kinase KdpD